MEAMPNLSDPTTPYPIGAAVDPSPAPRPAPVTLGGRHVIVRPLAPASDAAALYAASHGADNESLWRYLPDGPFADGAAFEAYLLARAAAADPLFFAIVDRGSGTAVGYAAYLRCEPAHRVVEIGHILYTPRLQRTAGATEAMYLLARHAFEDLGYRRYEWKCNSFNAPSRSAAQRFGFTFEGIFRQHMIVKGRSRDSAWYSMLDSEWPRRKAAFEGWLDPANFDATGRQKAPLAAFLPPET
jgi:RimJ/RimL family protein N-acetyltransferase